MKKRDKNRAARLEEIRKRLEQVATAGTAGFWRPKDGRNVIRILPEVGEMEVFWQEVGKHFVPNSSKVFVCPKFTTSGEMECPICDFVSELYASGDDESKALAGKLRVRKQFWMNIIDRDNEDAGPQIYGPGVMVFSAIASIIGDPDFGDIYDVSDGIDIVVEKSGSGLETSYEVRPRRHSTPLAEDPELVEAWLDKAKDLLPVYLTNDPSEDKDLMGDRVVAVLPYDRLLAEFESLDSELDEGKRGDEEEDEYEEDEYEEDEDEEPVARKRPRPRRRRRK